jgi:hypothetical protein
VGHDEFFFETIAFDQCELATNCEKCSQNR